MKIKDLKDLLEKFDENTKVMFSHTDSTDFNYKVNIKKRDIYLDDPTNDHSETPDKYYDDNFDYIGPKVLVFNLNLNED
jgi:hypothetical protein